MRVQVLGCSGGSAPGRQLTAFLIDGVLALDAGALTTALDLEAQRAVHAVALTHAHMDHVWSLPFFLANRFPGPSPTCRIVAGNETILALREHLFNDQIWPDFTRALLEGDAPLVEFEPRNPGLEFEVLGRYRLRGVAVTHTVPCQGYLVESGASSILVSGDTTVTEDLWTVASQAPGLGALVVECSWPDALEDLARRSGHLTPSLLRGELKRLKADVPVYLTHRKPGYEEPIAREIAALGDPRLRLLQDGDFLEV